MNQRLLFIKELQRNISMLRISLEAVTVGMKFLEDWLGDLAKLEEKK